MNSIFKLVLSVLAGIGVAFCVIYLCEGLNAKLYPSHSYNPSPEEMIAEIKTLPIQAFLLILTGYILSSFFGAYLASRLAPTPRKLYAGLAVGFFLLLGGIVNFISLPHPLWLSVSSTISFLLFSYIGARIAIK